MNRRISRTISLLALAALLAAVVLLPMWFTLVGSVSSSAELERLYGTASVLPRSFSLEGWYQVLLGTPRYLQKFWNSLLLCLCIVLGQTAVSVLGGYAFSKCRFAGQSALFFLLIIAMIMPVQVTLVPNYIILNRLYLLNTPLALILPPVFSPFGTFLMAQAFRQVPEELLDAARLDGAGTGRILRSVLVPLGKGWLVCLVLLTFLDAWNMVEQPITFLQDPMQYPLSVSLVYSGMQDLAVGFACGILAMLPAMFLYFFFSDDLLDSVDIAALK